jgi:transcriptional regulator with XRE-family HTH domain
LSPIASRDDHAVLARLISEMRREQGLSQQELADRLGVPQSLVSKIERVERLIDAVELLAVCRALGVPPAGVLVRLQSLIDRGRLR